MDNTRTGHSANVAFKRHAVDLARGQIKPNFLQVVPLICLELAQRMV